MRNRALPLCLCAAALALALASPVLARDSLGMFESWGAFRDASGPRCYAIAKPSAARTQRDHVPFASVGTWPKRKLRGQLHLRLSRTIRKGSAVSLLVGTERFVLVGSGANAWAANRRMDAAIAAAMRSASRMRVSGVDSRGRRFADSYALDGAASAMDAATLACARD